MTKRVPYLILSSFIVLSFIIKLFLILKYKNLLTLDSDDLNYVKSAVVLIKRGILTYGNYNEPTVFIMPLYPYFIALIFKIFGYGIFGLQVVRIIQALISSLTILIVFQTGKYLFNIKTALISAFLVSFYPPDIVTTGYMLTETIFTALLCLLILTSLVCTARPSKLNFFILGIIWAAAVLCRPTVALYPVMLLIFICMKYRYGIKKIFKYGIFMALSFTIILAPWWIRNYNEYGVFIPLSASTGNPMLQGTYIDYKQTPGNTVYYKIGKNAFETNKIEVQTAKKRIIEGFKKDFWGYLRWYTIGKTYFMWMTIFYWKAFLGITWYQVYLFHCLILIGFMGMVISLIKGFSKYFLPISVVIYFNIVHCVTMSFDRYAFPLLPIVSVFSGFILLKVFSSVSETARSIIKQ